MNILDIAKISDDCGIRGAPVTLTWSRLNAFAEEVAKRAIDEGRDEVARLRTQRDYLLSAARRTLDENGHLADGDNCTLHALKRAVETLTEVGA